MTESNIAQLIGLAGVPAIVAIVAMLKPWITDSNLWPPLALALALALNLTVAFARGTDPLEAAAAGLLAGLAAAGLYEIGRHYQADQWQVPDDQ